MMQMPKEFATEEEEGAWNDRNKELSTITHSFSGHERNRLFLNDRGRRFQDISGISGLDSPADGRVLVQFDYDRDGWTDFAVINSNRPLLQLFRNRLAERTRNASHTPQQFIAVKLVGGNAKPQPSSEFSCRDAWGAKLRLRTGDVWRLRELRCGEGLAGQNSSTLRIGLGEHDHVDAMEVRWPSGRVQKLPRLPAGSLVTVFENPADVPGEAGWLVQPYEKAADSHPPSTPTDESLPTFSLADSNNCRLNVVTTMASWCAACARHQPQLNELPAAFEDGCVQVVGFPFDEEDGADELQRFAQQNGVTYRLLQEPGDDDRDLLREILAGQVDPDVLPSSIVTDADGHVLLVTSGIPTVSQLRRLLAASQSRAADQ